MSEALPVTPAARSADPCAGASLAGEGEHRAAGASIALVEAMRRARKATAVTGEFAKTIKEMLHT